MQIPAPTIIPSVIRVLKDDGGATSVEYALVAALIALAIVTAAGSVGTETQRLWGSAQNGMSTAVNGN